MNCYQKRIKITSGCRTEWPSLILIGIPDSLSISGGKFEVKRAVYSSAVPTGHTPGEWSANRKPCFWSQNHFTLAGVIFDPPNAPVFESANALALPWTARQATSVRCSKAPLPLAGMYSPSAQTHP